MPAAHGMPNSMLAASSNGPLTPASGMGGGAMGGLNYDPNPPGYDFFDPQHWMLDNLLDFNYPYVAPLEGN